MSDAVMTLADLRAAQERLLAESTPVFGVQYTMMLAPAQARAFREAERVAALPLTYRRAHWIMRAAQKRGDVLAREGGRPTKEAQAWLSSGPVPLP